MNCSELTDLDLYNNPIGDLGDDIRATKPETIRPSRTHDECQNKLKFLKNSGVQILFDAPQLCKLIPSIYILMIVFITLYLRPTRLNRNGQN